MINRHYIAVREFYGDRTAERSKVPLIYHIDEGMIILNAIEGTARVRDAFCIHPMLQNDNDLLESMKVGSLFDRYKMDQRVVVLAMEYRRVANLYLSHHCKGEDDVIELSPIAEVNQMLVADKVQNRKDFQRFHLGTHANSDRLDMYFTNWLKRLGISEDRYQELCNIIRMYS